MGASAPVATDAPTSERVVSSFRCMRLRGTEAGRAARGSRSLTTARTPDSGPNCSGRPCCHRNGDDEAGFTDLEAFRALRLYDGPVVFFTRTVAEEREWRAAALGARFTEHPEDVLAWLPRT
jgi:hypothetical protein